MFSFGSIPAMSEWRITLLAVVAGFDGQRPAASFIKSLCFHGDPFTYASPSTQSSREASALNLIKTGPPYTLQSHLPPHADTGGRLGSEKTCIEQRGGKNKSSNNNKGKKRERLLWSKIFEVCLSKTITPAQS